MLFFGSPKIDLQITIFLLVVSFIISLVVLAAAKRKFLAVVVFSVLGNLSFLLNIGSRMFTVYHIKWLGYFSLLIWPILNIFLIYYYLKSKNEKS